MMGCKDKKCNDILLSFSTAIISVNIYLLGGSFCNLV